MQISVSQLAEMLYRQGLSSNTVKQYVGWCVRTEEWLSTRRLDLDGCPASAINHYFERILPSFHSKKVCRAALVAYWDVTGRDDPPAAACRVPRKPRMVCRALEPEDTRLLVKTAARWDDGPEGLAVELGLYLALRRVEIASLRWDNFSDDGWLTVTGKGDITAEIPVRPNVMERLDWWRSYEASYPYTSPGDIYLFPSTRSNCDRPHVHPETVWEWVGRVGDRAGVDVSTHELRHTALAEMNDRTGDLRTTQTFARHASPETTAGYTRTTAARLREAVDMIDY